MCVSIGLRDSVLEWYCLLIGVSIRFDWYGSMVTKGRLNVYLIVMENLYERNA